MIAARAGAFSRLSDACWVLADWRPDWRQHGQVRKGFVRGLSSPCPWEQGLGYVWSMDTSWAHALAGVAPELCTAFPPFG